MGKDTHDVFLSHDWRTAGNHEKVMHVATELKKRNVTSWIDAEQLRGGVLARRIVRGIHDSSVFVCFLTRSYCDKVEAEGERGFADWCFVEFHAALNLKTSKYMIPVVMDKELLDVRAWTSPLIRGILGGKAYIDMTDVRDGRACDLLAQRIKRMLTSSQTRRPSPTSTNGSRRGAAKRASIGDHRLTPASLRRTGRWRRSRRTRRTR